jgi:hypothetical protein
MHRLTIVCPIDYSDCSKRALRFAGALAEHFGARLVVLHVFDPSIAGTAALHNFDITGSVGQQELTPWRSCLWATRSLPQRSGGAQSVGQRLCCRVCEPA